MATEPSEKRGKSKNAEQQADVRVNVGSTSSQSGDAPEISDNIKDERYYRPLLQAIFSGDWEFTERFFEQNPASKEAKLTSRSETAFHIAALSAQDQCLEKLIDLLSPSPNVLEMDDCDGRTALHYAVLCGRIKMVETLVRKDPTLTQIADKGGRVPLSISAVEAYKYKEIAWFLAENTTDDEPSHPFSSPSMIDTMSSLTYAGHLDIVLYLVGRYPDLMTRRRDEPKSILYALAVTPPNFLSRPTLNILETLIYKSIPVDWKYKPTDKSLNPALQRLTRSLWNAAKIVVPTIRRVHEVKQRHVMAIELAKKICKEISCMETTKIIQFFQKDNVLFLATAKGISEIVKLSIQFFPELIRIEGNRLMTAAVEYRQERILGLFLKLTSTAELSLVPEPTFDDSIDMLHAAAWYERIISMRYVHSGTDVAGAAFQMQRELQWYKAVESWVNPEIRNAIYGDDDGKGKTCWNLFLKEHKVLLENGEKWAKDTATSCSVVSALIATVLFTAVFTVPGGNNQDTGVPLLLKQDSLLIFAISDALGLFSSVMAILLFLAILTSRYEAQDFLESLPRKIIIGLSLLFLSLAFLLVTFTAALKIVLDKKLEWAFIPIVLLASIPVALFAILQLSLLYQMIKSTYGHSIFQPKGIWDGAKYTKCD